MFKSVFKRDLKESALLLLEITFFVIICKILSVYFTDIEFDSWSINSMPKITNSRFLGTEYIYMKSLNIN